MAYGYLVWQDHAVTPSRTFTVKENDDGTITLTPAWTVVQQGTAQSAANFNNMDTGIMAANVASSEALRLINLLQDDVEGVQGVIIEQTFTNTYSYPFNNSQATVSIPTANTRRNTDYYVIAEVVDYEGDDVGDIHITDKLVNGFKAAFDGNATSVTIKFYVIGGMV
ncbi:MAG: hypothetical protein LUD01_01305 [Clostridiales bacterium]|nr:hypothetical protein [Clostridiales bacterium]